MIINVYLPVWYPPNRRSILHTYESDQDTHNVQKRSIRAGLVACFEIDQMNINNMFDDHSKQNQIPR